MKKWILVLFAICLLSGCITGMDAEGNKTYQLDPNTGAKIEQGVETGVTILSVASVIWPFLLPFAAGLGSAYGIYRKSVKPKFETAQTEAEMYYSVASAVVEAIEQFKEENPDDWDKLEIELTKLIGPKAENIIRALRGLPLIAG